MSDSAPRRSAFVGRTVYVDYESGSEVTDAQYKRIEKVLDAAEVLYAALHEAEGSSPPGEHQEHVWSSTRMRHAAEHLDIAMMYAKRACLEAK
jgi:hypothetical protein